MPAPILVREVVAVGSPQLVVVGGDAARVAAEVLTAVRQFGTAVAQVSSAARALADQRVWDGAAARRFRADQQAVEPHLRAMSASLLRMANGAQQVIQAIDNDDAAGVRALTLADTSPLQVEDPNLSADQLPTGASLTDPTQTAAWWRSLSQRQRDALIVRDHRVLGNLSGMPAADRSKANMLSLAEDLRSTNPAVNANAHHVQAALDKARTYVDPVTFKPVPAQLTLYDPRSFGGDGQAAISVGNVDTAQNVAVSVPGLWADTSAMQNYTDLAHNLYDESRRAAPGQSTAVVAWIGYNAPSGNGPKGLTEAAQWSQAADGAHYLTANVNGMLAARGDDKPHLTVIGHSYGSLTSGLAASQNGLKPDDLVLVGSVGTGVARASQLNVGAGHVWVGSASQDTASHLGWFVRDPARDDFGGTRFRAENSGFFPADTHDAFFDHVHYFDPGSESLYNMTQVVTGHYDSVLIAPHRGSLATVAAQATGLEPVPFAVGLLGPGDPELRADVAHPDYPDHIGDRLR